jgi:replicative DNA helicase
MTEPVDLKQTRRQRQPQNGHSIDRLPPSSFDAEQGVLGCILLNAREYYPEAREKISSNELFYSLPHQVIWDCLDEKQDILTVQQRLKDKGLLDQVGGILYLSQLQDKVPSAANLSYYLDLVVEKYLLRKTIAICTETVAKAYEHSGQVEAFMDEIEMAVLTISDQRNTKESKPISNSVQRVLDKLEHYQRNRGKFTGVATGFAKLDALTVGLQPGEVFVLAARPSCGKTSFSMQVAEHAAIVQGLPVGVFSMEMSEDALMFRMICGMAGVDSKKAQRGCLSQEDMTAIAHAAGAIRKAPLHVDDTPALTVNQLRGRGRRMWQKYKIKLGVIDYLQLMSSTSSKKSYNRQQEIGEISAGIKSLARETGIPWILLSQLNREMEKEKGRKPRLSDLRESGNIEQDADLVGMLYKPKVKDEKPDDDAEENDSIAVNFLLAKQRNGPSDRIIPLTFHKVITRFEDRQRPKPQPEPEDMPFDYQQ